MRSHKNYFNFYSLAKLCFDNDDEYIGDISCGIILHHVTLMVIHARILNKCFYFNKISSKTFLPSMFIRIYYTHVRIKYVYMHLLYIYLCAQSHTHLHLIILKILIRRRRSQVY